MSRRRALLALVPLSIALVGLLILDGVARYAARTMNRVAAGPAVEISEHAAALHSELTIVDLHADSLLWSRDLLRRSDAGHVDVPRLLEGGVALQGFTAVTQVPRGQNIERNGDGDLIWLLAVAQRWPPATWRSPLARALHQARRLHDFASASDGDLVVVRNREELRAYLARRAVDRDVTAGFLGIEGAQALDGDMDGLEALFDAGYRMFGLAHFFDNPVAGSAHGERRHGLTALGRRVVARIQERGGLIDVAHASVATIDDVTADATRPLVVSHTGVRGTCDNARNLGDRQIDAIAATGGVIGIGFWPGATCGADSAAIARAMRYVADRVGVEHVALGSDFDGTVTTPFDASGLVQLTQALIDVGFDDEQIRAIAGGNALRLLLEVLPESG